MELDPPGRVDPGATWERVVIAKLPAPVYGTSTWRLDLSAEGLPTFVVTERTSHLPGLLILLLIVLAIDLLVLVGRVMVRFQARQNQAHLAPAPGSEARPEMGYDYDTEPVLEYSN